MYPFLSRVVVGLGLVGSTIEVANATQNHLPDRDIPVAAGQPIPSVDFSRPPLFGDPELNSSGTHFAAPTRNKRLESNLLICEIETGKTKWSTAGVYSYTWLDDTHLWLNGLANGVVDIKDPTKQLLLTSVLPMGEPRGLKSKTGFFWTWPMDFIMPRSSGFIQDVWHRPEDGRPAYYMSIQQDAHRHLFWNDSGHWVECPVDLDDITPVALGSGPREMLVIGPAAKGAPRALQRLDTATGQLGDVLYRDPEFDCLPFVHFKPATHELIGVSVPTRTARVIWLDQRLKDAQELVNRQFPGMVSQIVSTDTRQNKMIIETESDRQPAVYNLLDLEKNSMGLLKRVVPWLDPARMAAMQSISYRSRDGAKIDGYLTLPAGASKEHPAPLIVYVHGGPWGVRMYAGFDVSAQFFASRGYAVLQVNYRGSAGYDARFEPGDRFNFQKMSDDVADGTHALTKSGLIDAQRVAVLGTGFGAYLALCGVVDEPALYRCAILYGGIYDWEKLFLKKDSRSMFADAWVRRRLHDFGLTPPAPMNRKERIKIPLFLTRNVTFGDLTLDTQIFDLYSAVKAQVPCDFFGDLNLYTANQANGEVPERLDKIEAFLTKYMVVK